MSKISKEIDADEESCLALLDYLKQKLCAYEIARNIRVSGYTLSLDDVVEILERLRREGFVRVIGVKDPDQFEREEVVTLIPALAEEKVEAKPQVVVEEKPPSEKVAAEVSKVVEEKVERTELPPPPAPTPFEEAISEEVRSKIIEIGELVSEKIRFDIETLLSLNTFIQNILIATRDGLPILQISRKNVSSVDDTRIAAASSVIMVQSENAASDLGKASVENVIVKTDKALMVIGYINASYILTFIVDVKTPEGLMLRDFQSLRRKIIKILESMKEGK